MHFKESKNFLLFFLHRELFGEFFFKELLIHRNNNKIH